MFYQMPIPATTAREIADILAAFDRACLRFEAAPPTRAMSKAVDAMYETAQQSIERLLEEAGHEDIEVLALVEADKGEPGPAYLLWSRGDEPQEHAHRLESF